MPGPAALLAAVPWQPQTRHFQLGPLPFTSVARLIGSLRVLPELADLGQLFKITHWHRKGGTRGNENEVCPHTAQGTVLNLYKCRALTQTLQTKCLFQREPFTAVPGTCCWKAVPRAPPVGPGACGAGRPSAPGRIGSGRDRGGRAARGGGHREGVWQGEASWVLQQAGWEAIRATHTINTPGG